MARYPFNFLLFDWIIEEPVKNIAILHTPRIETIIGCPQIDIKDFKCMETKEERPAIKKDDPIIRLLAF